MILTSVVFVYLYTCTYTAVSKFFYRYMYVVYVCTTHSLLEST
jgi:hypothetical protein